MAIAVRIARAYRCKDKVAFCGYHGWHDWYLAANIGTENALGEHLIQGLNPQGVPKALSGTALPFRYNHIEDLENIISKHKNELGAIVMEPIRNIQPKPNFLESVRKLADETGAVFIFDEISSGFRMNSGGAHLLYGINPDIAVFSKAIGNGFPIAAIIGNDAIMDAAQKTFISSTMWTERVGPVAALATIKKHRGVNAGDHLMAMGQMVQDGWRSLAIKYDLKVNVGGIPPLSHFSFQYENAMEIKALFIQLMLDHNFLASNLFYAMYAHKESHVQEYMKAVDEVFHIIAAALQKGDLKKLLKGQPSSAGFKRLT